MHRICSKHASKLSMIMISFSIRGSRGSFVNASSRSPPNILCLKRCSSVSSRRGECFLVEYVGNSLIQPDAVSPHQTQSCQKVLSFPRQPLPCGCYSSSSPHSRVPSTLAPRTTFKKYLMMLSLIVCFPLIFCLHILA